MNTQLNSSGKFLQTQLSSAGSLKEKKTEGHLINVGGVGGMVSAAYEQLRNVTEYTQEHLLRQRAIRRFYSRNLSFISRSKLDKSICEELIIELTQAGYIKNDTLSHDLLPVLHTLIAGHYETYWKLRDKGLDRAKAEKWILDLLSVETDAVIDPEYKLSVFSQFAFMHYKETLESDEFTENATQKEQFEPSLYVAVHRSLLKSDLANVRYDMLRLYRVKPDSIVDYIAFNQKIEEVYSSALCEKLTNRLNKIGAPLRIIKAMIEDNTSTAELLRDKNKFLQAYEMQIASEYTKAGSKLNSGLVRSILFLLITKALVGLLIEIPYDLAVTGAVIIMPLLINLLFPVGYLLFLRLSLKIPGKTNTRAMVAYADEMLFEGQRRVVLQSSIKPRQYSVMYPVLYGLMFIIAFGFVIERLISWDFNIVQGAIFFIFLASACFLGFRLSRIIRELELVTAKAGVISIIRDFLYLPFIVLGQKISEKYQKINIISLILDTVIELPLKTVLRLLRQWSSFLSEQKDRL